MAPEPAAALERFVDHWVGSGEVTAAFAAVATAERTLWSHGAAAPAEGAAPTAKSLFDAASLTKPWMATLALRLDASGELPLATTIAEAFPDCAPGLERITLEELLRHRAGFDPWTPLYRRCRTRTDAERLLTSGALMGSARRGRVGARPHARLGRSTRVPRRGGSEAATVALSVDESTARSRDTAAVRYSDLDYILWGFVAERRLGVPLESLLQRAVLAPMCIAGIEVRPGARAEVVPCRCDNAREVELAAQQRIRVARRGPPPVGEPQDGNARFLDGLAGHAGLFVSAEASLALGREWLLATRGGGVLLRQADALAALAGRGEYALGWARRRVAGSAGRALSSAAFGHLGFTGTSLWIDPGAGTLYLLLAHRSGASSQLNVARRRFHALAAACARALPSGAVR